MVCPGSRLAGGRGSSLSPARLGRSLRPRETTAFAKALGRRYGHAAAAFVLKPPLEFLPRRIWRSPTRAGTA
eukprot:8866420-Alexandrium_andersonii.AAC.1